MDAQELAALRGRLVAFARLQLGNVAAAEDVAQATLLAALENQQTFEGRSGMATWVFAILKNKILDELRRRQREPLIETLSDSDATLDALFDDIDHWVEMPSPWGNPQQSLEDKRFWQVLDACLLRLPRAAARVFTLRELMDLSTEAICKELQITPSNCWVLLHRARMGLRECLGIQWFAEAST